jgi:ankyrin repeat protein
MGAVVVGDLEIVDLLLQHGADPNAADSEGRTALLRAKVFRFGQIEERLLAGGAAPLRVPRVRFERLEAYSGRYGEPGAIHFQLIHDRGRLIMIEQGSNGLLYEKELLPLDERTFYRRGDPGLVLYRFELDLDGRVTGLSRPVGPGRQAAPRLD